MDEIRNDYLGNEMLEEVQHTAVASTEGGGFADAALVLGIGMVGGLLATGLIHGIGYIIKIRNAKKLADQINERFKNDTTIEAEEEDTEE